MISVTRASVDMLVANVKAREWYEAEMGIRTSLRSAEPVVRVDSARKLAEIAAVTGRSVERMGAARRVKYSGVVFQAFESEQKSDRRMPWQRR